MMKLNTVMEYTYRVRGRIDAAFFEDNAAETIRELDKVEQYGEFPMVKINGVVYYGPATFNSIASFVCRHIKDSLKGCASFVVEDVLEVTTAGRVFKWVCLVLVAGLSVALIMLCQKSMKKKFDSDLSYKIDQSVSEYLKKTGGTDL